MIFITGSTISILWKILFMLCDAFTGVVEIMPLVVDLFCAYDIVIMAMTNVIGRTVIFFEALNYTKI